MKKIFFLLAAFLFAIPSFAQDTMQLVYFSDGAPFSWEENGKMNGILVDIIEEAIHARMGIIVSHKGYPWTRAQMMVQKGKADAFVTVPTSERQAYTKVNSEPVVQVTFTLFTQKDGPKTEALKKVKKIDELKGFTIGHYLGSGWAEQKLNGMKVEWTSNVFQTLKKLAAGRVDVFVDTSQGVLFNIKKFGFQDQIIEIPNVVDSAPFHLCVRKNSSFVIILSQFDEIIKEMRKDGTLEEIYNRYK
ncbi:MAG: transporter substrate-binding domain-containing protein [Deltaproteobacteria bacterium]|nr:transporter substrate-binding domain-containing protein [Deltaproteobacteria bacterium]